MPDVILKEQIGLLGDKSEFVIYGKAKSIQVQSERIDYKLATMFDVVVPALDGYEKTLFIAYSNPEQEYPIAITVGTNYEDDCESFHPLYVCRNKEEFDKSSERLFKSKEILDVIQTLYSKAVMLSN